MVLRGEFHPQSVCRIAGLSCTFKHCCGTDRHAAALHFASYGQLSLNTRTSDTAQYSGKKGENPGAWVLTANCETIFSGGVVHMYTQRPLFSHQGGDYYRKVIKSRLRHFRRLCCLSQSQAARIAGVARSTWQAWESETRTALPDAAQLAAVADAARVDPAAALDWLIGGAERKQL